MNLKQVTLENLDSEHICCAIADIKGETCVASKKAWLRERIKEGLVFKKLDVRGKVFIEYIPAEYAWCPIEADGYMYIDCLWVSGQYKGLGYANELLAQCIADSKEKGKKGIVILSSKKKMPFLSDPKFLRHQGFIVTDTAEPYYELLYFPFEESDVVPKFKECAKFGKIDERGFVLYYTNQCPHTDKYAPLLEDVIKEYGMKLKRIKIDSKEAAKNAPSPFTTYSLFYNGNFVTNEILSEKSFAKYWVKLKPEC